MSSKKPSEGEKDLLSLFGEDTLYLDGDIGTVGTYDIIKTGSPSLDYALGIGGMPRGRIIQLAGKESSGKTLLSLLCMKSWLDENPDNTVMFIDAEYTYDANWARSLGVDTSRVVVAKTNDAKKIFEGLLGKMTVNKTTGKASKSVKGVLDLVKEGVDPRFKNLGLIVLDSVAAMNTPMEVDAAIGKQNMAPMPRFLSTELKKLTPAIADANVSMIFINQVRTDPGVMYGNPECVDPFSTKIKVRTSDSAPVELYVSELFERVIPESILDFSKPAVYDISERGIEIESLILESKQKSFSLIQNLIIKESVDIHYKIGTLKVTSGHLIYNESSSSFIRADEYPGAEKVNERIFVADFTVSETHNYFANGLLNHNTSPGGKALKHACSVMVNMAPISGADSKVEDENENVIGHKVRAKIQKNKVGAPFREAVYTIKYTEGIINREEELLDLAVLCKIINRPNNRSYELGNDKFSSRQAMIDYLKDEACFGGVEDLCRSKYLSGEVAGPVISDQEESEEIETLFDVMES